MCSDAFCRSDHIWSFGQFLDHDLVATVAAQPSDGDVWNVKVKQGKRSKTMKLTRLLVRPTWFALGSGHVRHHYVVVRAYYNTAATH